LKVALEVFGAPFKTWDATSRTLNAPLKIFGTPFQGCEAELETFEGSLEV